MIFFDHERSVDLKSGVMMFNPRVFSGSACNPHVGEDGGVCPVMLGINFSRIIVLLVSKTFVKLDVVRDRKSQLCCCLFVKGRWFMVPVGARCCSAFAEVNGASNSHLRQACSHLPKVFPIVYSRLALARWARALMNTKLLLHWNWILSRLVARTVHSWCL